MISKYINILCCEDPSLIKNYELAINDDTQIWDCHHRLEIDEKKSAQQLKNENRYYNRPASELIFLTKSDHWTLHMLNLRDETKILYSKRSSGENNPMHGNGYKITGDKNGMFGKSIKDFMTNEEYNNWKIAISNGTRGKNNPMYGKNHSEETRKRQSKTKKEYWLTHEFDKSTKEKLSDMMKNKIWVNNGINSKRIYDEQLQQYLDKGYKLGRLYFKRRRRKTTNQI